MTTRPIKVEELGKARVLVGNTCFALIKAYEQRYGTLDLGRTLNEAPPPADIDR